MRNQANLEHRINQPLKWRQRSEMHAALVEHVRFAGKPPRLLEVGCRSGIKRLNNTRKFLKPDRTVIAALTSEMQQSIKLHTLSILKYRCTCSRVHSIRARFLTPSWMSVIISALSVSVAPVAQGRGGGGGGG
jgi:hypothetical protein